jgi:rhodanese-related sulfurtransferase
MKDNWLNKLMIAAGLFAIIIIIGLVTMRKPAFHYKLTEKKTLAAVLNPDDQLSPDKAKEILQSKNPAYQFVDIRTPYEFMKGHIDGAVNISQSSLFSEENYDFLKQVDKDNKTLVLYGTDQSQANAPWMMMKQLGLSKVMVLQGGYDYYTGPQKTMADSLPAKGYDSELARYNYAEMVKGLSTTEQSSSQKTAPQKLITKPKPKSNSPAAGGC